MAREWSLNLRIPDREFRTPPSLCAAVRTRDSEFVGGHGGESGEFHCKLAHAVQIEPSLRPRSPENGNISTIRRRLSAISLRECPKS